MFNNMTTVSQGSVGLGLAIAWFVEKGYIVSLPLNDNQSYDMVVDKGDGLKRIDVKTTQYKDAGKYSVQLRAIRSNRTMNKIRKFDANGSDFVFVVTEDKTLYLIPSIELDGKSTIWLGEKADKWKIS